MLQITMIVCLGVAILSIIKDRTLASPLFIFSGIWVILLFFENLELFHLYTTDEKYYLLMLIGVTSFAVGYFVFTNFSIHVKLSNKVRSVNRVIYLKRRKILYFFCFISILFYLKDLFVLLPSLSSGGLAAIRKINQTSGSILGESRSSLESFVRTLFVGPFCFAVLPITAVDFFGENRDKKLFVYTISIIALRLLTEGGRFVIAYFMLHLWLSYTLQGKKGFLVNVVSSVKDIRSFVKRFRKRRRYMLFIGIVILCLGFYVLYISTIARSGEDALIHMYFYVSMQGKMLEIWGIRVDASGLIGGGLASLNGFLYPIIYFFKNLFGYSEFPGYWGKIINIIQATDSEWQFISGYGRANAFVSIFWFPYLDGRYIGEIVIMFIYGAVSSRIFKKAVDKPNDLNIAICLLLVQGLFSSFVRLQFSNVYYALAFIHIALLYKKKVVLEQDIE